MLPLQTLLRHKTRNTIIHHFLQSNRRNSIISKAAFHTTRVMAEEFKLKGFTSSPDLQEGEKREVEVEGVEDGKVLLVNVAGKITALGAKCTHYGAPLKNGILTSDGRITCPWHGACFNATNGDIENAPAIDNLPCFPISTKDGSVFISGTKEAIKGSRRKPNLKVNGASTRKSEEKVVIVGGGSGAIGTLEALRETGFRGSITMISSEGYLPIDRTKLSKGLITDPQKVALRDAAWFEDAAVDTITGEVTGVDFSAKKVSTKEGESYSYYKLVLASGGTPKNLPLPGFKDLKNIFVLRTVNDVKSIMEAVGDKGKKIVIVGSSFIGMEVANAVAKDNTVSVIGMEKVPLERVMGEEVGAVFQKMLEKNGVKFFMSAGVDMATPDEKDPSKVGAILLKDGQSLEADLVILGVGVAPATTYLKDNKAVTLEKDGSLKTDEHFAVKGVDDVWAIGDIATYPYHGPGGNGSPVRIEHWNVAQNAGRVAASNIIDSSAKAKLFIPIFWSAMGQNLRYCGNTMAGGYDEVVIKGELADAKFMAWYFKGDDAVAVATMGMDPVVMKAAEMMRTGKAITKETIEAGQDKFLAISI